MKNSGIPLKGMRVDKHGKLVRSTKGMSVSARIKQKKSKRVRVTKGAP
jgi:hypothetical protein